MTTLPRRLVVRLIGLYQAGVSPSLGVNCRFQPTCSAYAKEAVARFGVVKGAWLTIRRLGKCHPFHAGGFDPVPHGGGD